MTMNETTTSGQGVGGRTPRPVGRRWLVPGAVIMAAAGITTGAALLYHAAGLRRAQAGLVERLFEALRNDTGIDVYLLAVAFLLVSSLTVVMGADRVVSLVFALMSIAVLLILPLTVLALDIPPFGFDIRLTSGSLRQLAIFLGPLVASLGWLVALYGHLRARPARGDRAGTPSPGW